MGRWAYFGRVGEEDSRKGVKKVKAERKKPEFTFEDFHEIMENCYAQSSVDVMGMILGVELLEEIARRILLHWKTKSYKDKPLRKKLKLYIKWLQSEMSKRESSK